MATPFPARPLRSAIDLDPVLAAIGEARVVLLGEASHGTHEYYTWRAALSKRLIQEKGFQFIGVEGDWPDCFEVNTAIKQDAVTHGSAAQLLQIFNRWPTWMWGNWKVVALVKWLHRHNQSRPSEGRVGFYGLDVVHVTDDAQARPDDGSVLETVRTNALVNGFAESRLHEVYHPAVVAGVLGEAARQQADLLVVVARRHSLLGSLFHRSVTALLIQESPIPVLILPAAG